MENITALFDADTVKEFINYALSMDWFSVDLMIRCIVFGAVIAGLLPFILAPILPKRFKAKTVLELDCNAQKAFDVLVEDPRKCPMTGKQMNQISASVDDADEKRRPLKWREEVIKNRRPEIYSIEQSFEAFKPGKTAHIVRTSKHETMPVETEWKYEIETIDKNSCRITLEGFVDIHDGKWQEPVPLLRMMMWMEGPKTAMRSHLNMVADATGAKRTWVS